MAMSSGKVNDTELISALINQKEDLIEGIKYAQSVVDGSLTLLVMEQDGSIIAARDRMGRLPVLIGKNDEGHCISFESFPYQKLGYVDEYELGPQRNRPRHRRRLRDPLARNRRHEDLRVSVGVLRLPPTPTTRA